MTVKFFDKWGNPSQMAELEAQIELAKHLGAEPDTNPHSITQPQLEKVARRVAAEGMTGQLASANAPYRAAYDKLVPDGYQPTGRLAQGRTRQSPFQKAAQMFGGATTSNSGNSPVYQTQRRPFMPEFHGAFQSFPQHRREVNSYMRLMRKMDSTVNAAISLIAELPWSEFQFVGEGVDGEVKEALDYTVKETKLLSKLTMGLAEYLTTGEFIPHLHYNDSLGVWDFLSIHNPDFINVVYSPFLPMEPLIEFVPDPKLRQIVTSDHPHLAKYRESMPADLVSMVQSGRNIPLSSTNVSFLPRKLHDSDIRGTSALTPLWMPWESELALWDAFTQTSRRMSNPLKVAKLGDPATNTFATPAERQKFVELIAQAEQDPVSFLVWNHQVQFEMVGGGDRLMSINTHYDLFERIKLTNFGISQAFLTGDASYSSSAAGLTVFLQRLKAYRDLFVNEWLIPKFLMPLAVLNKWIKPDKASKGQMRIKRSHKEMRMENLYIVPQIEWKKTLDPTIDRERIDALTALETQLGIKISDQKKFACVGLEPEEQYKTVLEEIATKRDLAGEDPVKQAALGLLGPQDGSGGGGGGLGGAPPMVSPGIPGDAFGMGGDPGAGAPPPEGGEGLPGGDTGGLPGATPEGAPPSPEGASIKADEESTQDVGKGKNEDDAKKVKYPNQSPRKSPWDKETLQPLLKVFDSFDKRDLADHDLWRFSLKDDAVREAIEAQDAVLLWDALESWCIDENYPSNVIRALRDILRAKGKLSDSLAARQKSAKADERYKQALAQLGVSEDELAEFAVIGKSTRLV